jgi:murein DD-endopeptidase MepM/ murein hydrolase activator NlpD
MPAIALDPVGSGPLPMPLGKRYDDHSFSILRPDANAADESVLMMTGTANGVRPVFQWPVRPSVVLSDPGIHTIVNFVDNDAGFPGQILDYNCGARTYDLNNGYNHQGVDIAAWPFKWYRMERDEVLAVAAARGTLIAKEDLQPDMACGGEISQPVNQVILQHDDGSKSVYLHFKRSSVTAKSIGQVVDEGEYLGVLGSSGFSTGPHLHFEVEDSNGSVVDPYAGDCNLLNDDGWGDSWWANQAPYYDSAINRLATHSRAPEFGECPATEIPNFKDVFKRRDRIIFAAYFRDQLRDQLTTYLVTDPNGRVEIAWQDWLVDQDHLPGSYWLWTWEIPEHAVAGEWKFTADYLGEITEHVFYVESGPPDPPAAPSGNNAFNGLWYDPALDGEGYNIVTAEAGTVFYFYGSDNSGERLWLISDLFYGAINADLPFTLAMYESTGGSFASPIVSKRGLSAWGTLTIELAGCNSGKALLEGTDGAKVSQIVKLADVAGTSCNDSGPPLADAPLSGLWFDQSREGEGFNIVVTTGGAVLYYYGFNQDGQRLWLISDLVEGNLAMGKKSEVILFEAVDGEFSHPVPSREALDPWGTATITPVDCSKIEIIIDGEDGRKVSNTERLAGIIGLECNL